MHKSLIALLIVATLPSCATITRGTTQAFTITSDPSGAEARLSNGLSCETPCSLEVKRRPGFVVTVEKDSYRSVQVNFISTVSGVGGAAMAGYVVLGGIIGVGVDASNGSMNELTPNPLHVMLEEVGVEQRAGVGSAGE